MLTSTLPSTLFYHSTLAHIHLSTPELSLLLSPNRTGSLTMAPRSTFLSSRRRQPKKRSSRQTRASRNVDTPSQAPASLRASAQDQQNAELPLPGHHCTSQPPIISLIASYIIENPDGPDVYFHCCFQRTIILIS